MSGYQNITIRKMTEADIDNVMKIEIRSFPNPWRRSFFLSDISRPDALCVVAEEGGKIIGYLIAWGTQEVHIANIAVAPESRRSGVGTALMQQVLAFARKQKAAGVYLEVRFSNIGAQRFYQRFGFVPTYLRKGYYENGEDAIVMELVIDTGQKA